MYNNLIPLYLYQGNPLPPPEYLYDYVLASQGFVKRAETRHATVDMLLSPLPEHLTLTGLKLQPWPFQGIRLKVPRIPESLLLDILEDARQDIHKEFMYQVHFDPATGSYRADRPPQTGTKYNVKSYGSGDPATLLMEIHSHNSMPAFFSGVDDRDEQGGKFYAVMGQIDTEQPQLALRLGLFGHWAYNVPPDILFDGIGPFTEAWSSGGAEQPLPDEWEDSGWSFKNLFNWMR